MFLFDARTPKQAYSHTAVGDIEAASWDPITTSNIIYSTEQGQVVLLDARKFDQKPIVDFKVSPKAVSSVSMSPDVPGLMATTSLDGKICIYDVQSVNSDGSLKLITQNNPKLDKLYCG